LVWKHDWVSGGAALVGGWMGGW